ncbi:MAG: ABC transporter ATP-binding protein [Actinomycetaceae bacterium]|nr:ABC transporter ATP-binding protein [Actinomycetaceae bacterium]MDY6142830.1 ABC transporter ATP-binding protein [Arcanobacterium sp.]
MTDITKTYDVEPPLPVLDGVNLAVTYGERVAIVGRSGAGKSTLLNILGLLDSPSSGTYQFEGEHTQALRESELNILRAQRIGFVFQDFHVLPHRSIAENLELKLAINQISIPERKALIQQALGTVGLTERINAQTRLLSGGEKQRLAIARAIITRPRLLLADEPTGNLDEDNAKSVLRLFDEQVEQGVSVIVITHDERLAAWADRVLHLRGGQLYEG